MYYSVISNFSKSPYLYRYNELVGFPGGRKEFCQIGDTGLIPGSGRSPGKGRGNHFSILVWEIQWTEESDGLQLMGLQNWI